MDLALNIQQCENKGYMKVFFQILLVVLLFSSGSSFAQGYTKEELRDSILPSFSTYKDIYFISGVPLHTDISKHSADAKYQISFKQLLTRYRFPFNSSLFLTYTQKAFWNIYEFSSPFQEINFNPGIGWGIPIFNRDGRLSDLLELKVEHESNGRDSIYSRSWNEVSLAYHTMLNDRTQLSVTGWIPFAYKENNADLMDYIGYGEFNLSYDLKPEKLFLDLNLRKGMKDWKGSVRSRLSYRISKKTNQYMMLEWFNGYAESLLDYRQHKSMLRFGYVIRSSDRDILRSTPKR